jgi:hypothetical protein
VYNLSAPNIYIYMCVRVCVRVCVYVCVYVIAIIRHLDLTSVLSVRCVKIEIKFWRWQLW